LSAVLEVGAGSDHGSDDHSGGAVEGSVELLDFSAEFADFSSEAADFSFDAVEALVGLVTSAG